MSDNFRNTKEYERIFDAISKRIKTIPSRVAVVAINFSKERFEKKDWHDDVSQKWKVTKKKKGSTLVASGRLRRSIRKISVTSSRVVIGTNEPYARIHNDGGEISGTERVREHRRRTHRRKGYTRKAHTRNGRHIETKRVKSQIVKSYTVKGHSRKYRRKFVKRQFIGKSKELLRRVEKLIGSEIQNAIDTAKRI